MADHAKKAVMEAAKSWIDKIADKRGIKLPPVKPALLEPEEEEVDEVAQALENAKPRSIVLVRARRGAGVKTEEAENATGWKVRFQGTCEERTALVPPDGLAPAARRVRRKDD